MKWNRRVAVDKETAPEAVAARCASLLRGGVDPNRVFGLLAEERPYGSIEQRIHRAVESGESPGAAIARCGPVHRRGGGDVESHDEAEWRLLAVSWQLAEETGAPLVGVLERIAEALSTLRRLRERRGVLLAGPRATTRLVAALPPLVLAMGWALGFDPSPVLLSWSGAAMVGAGLVLLGLGVVWSKRLTRRVQSDDRVEGIELELVWVALGGGSAPAEAVRRVVDVVDRTQISWVSYDRFCEDSALTEVLRRAAAVGMPLGPLLLAEATNLRASSHAELEAAAERLGVRMLIPLGVCVLPSFIVMGVLPVVISMVSGDLL